MSMYLDYVSEREGFDGVENEHGFATFIIQGKECYLRDMYVRPESRHSGHGQHLLMQVEEAAQEKGCEVLSTSVKPSANGSTRSVKVILEAGFQVAASFQDAIFFKKELI